MRLKLAISSGLSFSAVLALSSMLPACAHANTESTTKEATAITQNITAPSVAVSFTLAPLPYSYDALEPAIDAQTMTIHHSRHHKAYVDNLNRAISENPSFANKSLLELFAAASSLPPAVRNNGGGHWNHTFFWESMIGASQSGAPSQQLTSAIIAKFGSMDNFKAEFKKAGLGRFGSGWVWLIVDNNGQLAISTTPYQDNPLMNDVSQKGAPLLGNDLWEHAYYLKYQNKRADYLDGWWQIVNWNVVSARYEAAIKK